ncbi:hypothetical protein [Mycobacterium sp.]|uniref:hypothetical protein n=1 Tax=Mycobacterium sp. TaxID=1785 RepID=UPI002DA450E8|nr:hypothetical protein [Mycobacterium sp.]
MSTQKALYEKWVNELWAGRPVAAEVGPLVDGGLVAGRWVGTGKTQDGPMRFTGNDILRSADGRFVEYWTGTSTA